MKKLLLLVVAAVALSTANAQVFFIDSFANSTLPGWKAVNFKAPGSTVIWKWDNTSASASGGTFNHAGAANGAILADSDGDANPNGTTKEYTVITSNAINCTGKPTILLNFVEYFVKFQKDTPEVFISNDSVSWTLVHTPATGLTPNTETANPNAVEVNVSAVAGNQAKVYIRFSWKATYDYWWFVDDVSLRVPDPNEAVATSVDNLVSNGCTLSNAEPISITFRNGGLTSISSIVAKYSINGGAPVSENVTISPALAFDSSYTYNFTTPANFSGATPYGINGWVELTGDANHTNDTAFSLAVSVSPANLATAYSTSFELPNDLNTFTWTHEDVNGDDFSWFLTGNSPNTGNVAYRYFYNVDGTTAADDWLFSPCLSLDSSKAYRISFYDKVGSDPGVIYPEKLSLSAGTTKTAAGMTELVSDLGELSDTAYAQRKLAFKPATSSTYYLGFHAYSDPDNYYLNLDDINIDVLPKPSATFAISANGNDATVTDGSDDLITNWTWSWGDNTANSTGLDPGVHTYAGPGTYTVCLKVTNLAGTDSVCHDVTITSVGVANVDATEQISVYPNPTNRILNVMVGALKNNTTIEITNVLGETMMTRETSGNSVEKFDLEKIAQGVYFVRVTANGTKTIRKFVYAK